MKGIAMERMMDLLEVEFESSDTYTELFESLDTKLIADPVTLISSHIQVALWEFLEAVKPLPDDVCSSDVMAMLTKAVLKAIRETIQDYYGGI